MSEENIKKGGNINNIQAVCLVVVAVLLDAVITLVSLLHLIPAVGNIIAGTIAFFINFFAGLTFLTWFLVLGVKFFRARGAMVRLGSLGGGWFLGSIPLVSIFPFWVFSVIITIASDRKSGLPGPVGKSLLGKTAEK